MMEGGGSDGGREWCGVMERGSSPGLIVAHVCSLLPMSTCRCLCLHVVAHVGSHLWAVIFVCEWSPLFVGSRFHSRAVVFVHTQSLLFVGIHFHGLSPSFVGGGLCLWVLVFTCGQSPSFVGNLAVGVVWWWAVGGWWWVLIAVHGGGEVGVVMLCHHVH